MATKKGVLLSSIKQFPADKAQVLAGFWITTAEELVSAAIREEGPSGLAQILNISVDQVAELVDLAQSVLPPDVHFAAGDVQPFGLGAMDEPGEDEEGNRAMLSFAPLPPKVDLTSKMSPIRNQGQRGTCVSFACTAVREYLTVTNGEQRDLSEQYLYWSCKQHDLLPGPGTFIGVAMERLLVEGQCTEDIWPYNGVPVAGNEGQNPPPPDAAAKASAYRISSTQRVPARSVDSLRQALANGSPVAFAVPVYTYWFTEPLRTTGDIRLPLPTDHLEGGHAMCIVGYEDDPEIPGGGYFMIRNSWGTYWASKSSISAGYARLPYAYMQQYASAAHIAAAEAPKPDVEQNDGCFAAVIRFFKQMFGG